jgi:hypothetical protein
MGRQTHLVAKRTAEMELVDPRFVGDLVERKGFGIAAPKNVLRAAKRHGPEAPDPARRWAGGEADERRERLGQRGFEREAAGARVIEERVEREERSCRRVVALQREVRWGSECPPTEGASGVLDDLILEEDNLELSRSVAARLPVNLAGKLELN